jgi:hypothetical protein
MAVMSQERRVSSKEHWIMVLVPGGNPSQERIVWAVSLIAVSWVSSTFKLNLGRVG